jgi:2-phospho-L-lactate/phosphoenolpyruvate guanylyltransferase
MKHLAVIVPVKSAGKSRLSTVFSEAERAAFARTLFRGLMKTLTGAGLVGSCLVVSSDQGVLSMASGFGARTVPESGNHGVNSAVQKGMRGADWAKEFLILPSDLPMLRGSDLNAILRLRRAGLRILISPSIAFDGTNALLFPREPRLALSYDSNSFWTHLANASRLGVPVGVCAREGIMFDIDSPDDLRRLAGSGSKSEASAMARGAFR